MNSPTAVGVAYGFEPIRESLDSGTTARFPKTSYLQESEMTTMLRKEWLSPSDLEAEFGIKISSQNKMRMAKTIPYSKFGKHVKYSRAKIHAMLEDAEVCDGTGK